MANTKRTMLDLLVTELGNSSSVATATRTLLTPANARKKSPYVGIISGTEEVIVEDSTDIRYELDIDLILLKKGRDIEDMLDAVKTLLYGSSLSSTIGALQVKVIGQQEVALIDADDYSSTRIVMTITYVASKGAF